MLDNVILMLWPTINPDGQQMVAEWYMKNVGTPYELSGLPQLYQEYVGHDNNRDAYMLNMIESRVIEHVWRQWEPQIVYVHHQTGPFPTRIWLPPFSEPVGLEAPPVIAREVNMIGMAIAKNLDEKGQPGATHMGTAFDAWYPGYIDYAPIFKNIAAYWTETALYSYATPREYTIDDFPPNMRDLRPQSLYSSPWKPGWWRLRDAVDYMETASLATIEYASKYKDSLLMNRYRAGRDQIALGATKPPFAYPSPRSSAIPSPPSRCCGAWRSGACASELPTRATTAPPPGRGSFRPTRSLPRWRAKSSTCSAIRTCGSIPAVRPSVRTTPPAGAFRCKWASGSSRRCRRFADARARMRLLGPPRI